MAQLNKGDTVRLKSGGPLMTVGETINGNYDCFWFNNVDGEWTVKSQIFSPELLKTSQSS
ncbi:DUF2158 domain-containing protein [Bradyrhizobium sp. 139]|uniref:YodC family protein n=1 Tax=Bradyrhizobium sp. 139 TaxID=2782616 RepID=UPI002112B611|nr:DUF2158 domain-containing protein [Bradyrhizobium sp. 139]MCK1742227.1 DUF2158 domain-containing protein [Bradyrhizobium sp. 139]